VRGQAGGGRVRLRVGELPEDNGAPPFWVWGQLLGQLGAGDLLRPGAGNADPDLARFLLFEAVAARIVLTYRI
jgi:hypothetical protein